MKLMKSNKLNWFGRLQGNWCRRKTGLAGKLVSQGNWFLVTLAKIFFIILMVKQITYNAKVNDITIL